MVTESSLPQRDHHAGTRTAGEATGDPLPRAFGDQVRRLREQAGISQEDLAHEIGMSRRYMSGVERGEANPTLDQILRIAVGLGVDVAELMPSRRGRSPGRRGDGSD